MNEFADNIKSNNVFLVEDTDGRLFIKYYDMTIPTTKRKWQLIKEVLKAIEDNGYTR
jgi:hypothetical protein